jgi:hypothetical protein
MRNTAARWNLTGQESPTDEDRKGLVAFNARMENVVPASGLSLPTTKRGWVIGVAKVGLGIVVIGAAAMSLRSVIMKYR